MAPVGSQRKGEHRSDPSLRAVIDDLDALADAEPQLAAERARELLDKHGDDDSVLVANCERVLAAAAVRTADVASAEGHIARAIDAARPLGDDTLHGRVLLTATAVAATGGDFDRALRTVDCARELLSEEHLVRADLQRATVLMVANRDDEAIEIFVEVLTSGRLRRESDRSKLRFNLGTLLLRRGRASASIEHLDTARQAYRADGNRDLATACSLHLAEAYSRLGDHAAVFELHRQLEGDEALSASDPRSLLDLGRVLLGAGLFDEARRSIDRAARIVEASPTSEVSLQIGLADARLRRRTGDPSAAEVARATLRDAERMGDEVMQVRSTVELVAAGAREPSDAEILITAAGRFRSLGLNREAVDAEILAMDLVRLDPDRARSVAERIDPIEVDAATPVERAQLQHRRALLACSRGEFGEARRHAAVALRGLEQARARLGSSELRVAAADRAPELAQLGVDLAVRSGRPRDVLEWAERQRAASVRFSQPEGGVDAMPELDEHRKAGDDRERRASVERRINARTRMRRTSATVQRTYSASEIRATLPPGATLLEYVIVGDDVVAVTATPSGTRLEALAIDVATLEDAIGKILYGLRRSSVTTGRSAENASRMVDALAGRLDEWLLPAALVDDGEVVVVPCGPLHSLPWSALPRLREREVSIAPSAHAWVRAARRWDERPGVLVVSGPGLPEAAAEVDDVTAAWTGRAVAMPMATTSGLASTLDDVRLVHIAAHGRFRTDSPQFSSLELADGGFTVLDLDALAALPSIVVLSACELGSVDVRIGDDLLGFPAALLARGVRSLVAALVPVEDGASRTFSRLVHHRLAEGACVASAVRSARVEMWDAGPSHRAAAASYSCFGAAGPPTNVGTV